MTKNALWLIVAKTAAFVLNLAVPLLLVRHLAVREFGVYKQLFLLIDTALVNLPLGFAMSAFYFFPREPARRPQVVGNILLVYAFVGGLGGMLVVAFPTQLAAALNSHDLPAYAPVIGIAMALLVGSSFIEAVAIAHGEARVAAFVIATTQFLRSAVLVAAAGVFGSVRALAYAAVVNGLLQSAVAVWYVRSRFSPVLRPVEWRLLRAQLAYAFPLAYAALLYWIQGYGHHYFVSNRYGPAAYAIYAIGCFQLPIMGILIESVGSVMIPRVSDLRRRRETREIVRLVARMVRTLAAVALPVYALLLVTGRDFLTVLFTPRYLDSWPIFAVNLTTIPFICIAPACDAVFRASPEHLPFLVKVRTALFAPLLGGLWIATHEFSMVTVIAVVIGVTLVERTLVAIRVARILGMSWSDLGLFGDVAKLAVAAGVGGLATEITRHILLRGLDGAPLAALMISACVFAVVYLGAVLRLRVPTPGEREALRQWWTRVYRVAPWSNATGAPEHGEA